MSICFCQYIESRSTKAFLAWNQLLTICNKIVTRLFQQVRYNHDIAVLLQPCVVNLVTFLFIMTVSVMLEQPCDKSDNREVTIPRFQFTGTGEIHVPVPVNRGTTCNLRNPRYSP